MGEAGFHTPTAKMTIHGVENLRALLRVTMQIKDWRQIKELLSEHRMQLEYTAYYNFLQLIGGLLEQVEHTVFVAELEDKDEKDEEKEESV